VVQPFSSRRPSMSAERENLVRVAWMYYRDELTQAQIAERLHVSRATVARMLDRAKEVGVVTIDIDTRGVGGMELVGAIRAKYGLTDVIVVPQMGRSTSGEATNSRIALEAAQYLRRYLHPGATIGVGWGDTVLRTLLALRSDSLRGVTFPTLTGGIDAYTARVSGALSNGVAELIRFVPSPLLASSPEVAAMLRKERSVTSVIELAKSADAALIGIGGAIADATILQHGLVTEEQLYDYQVAGAIGDILGEWYDKEGNVLAVDLQKVRVGIALADLRSMRNVIAVAGGVDKLDAIRGALDGGYVGILVTTEDVARELAAD